MIRNTISHPIDFKPFSRTVLLMVCSLFLFSCEPFIEVDPPNDQLVGKIVFEDPATVEAALTNIYAHLRDDGITNGQLYGMGTLLGLYSDELDLYSNSLPQVEAFYTNNLSVSNTNVSSFWTSSYNLIYAANSIIEGVSSSTSLEQQTKDRFLGEAYFIRAFLHFYLVNIFGDVPYIDTSDYIKNSKVSRTPVSKVNEALIADLITAKSLLETNDTANDNIRPNAWVASALLARVYLYMGNWQKALEESDGIISSGHYNLEPDINSVFLKTSTETLWQFSPAASGYNTYEGYTFIFNSGPPPSVALTGTLIQAFEPADLRLAFWTKGITNGTDTWYHANKYKQRTPTSASLEYSIVFRLAEQYLIRAEAETKLGDLDGARQDIDKLRTRAGLGNTLATTEDSLLDVVLQERQKELFTEFGHRWFDLKRTAKAETILGAAKIGWNATDTLLPIPESELVLNPNLNPQNSGY